VQGVVQLIDDRNKKGTIHFSNVVRVLAENGYTCAKSKVKSIDSSHWSKIVKKKIHVPENEKTQPQESQHQRNRKDKIQTIIDFWNSDEISRISSGKTCVIKKKTHISPQKTMPVRYRLYTIEKSYEIFKEKYGKDFCCQGTFFNCKPKWIKRSRSKVDCCPICKQKHKFEKKMAEKPEVQWTKEEKEIKEEFEFHETIWRQRQQDYDAEVASLVEGKCMLVMDFKANISLGKGPEQDADVFFKAPQRTVFGIVGFFKKENETHKITFNVVSPILNHDSTMVRDILQKVLKHKTFQQFNVHTVSFWMDNAPNHFRTREMYATMLEINDFLNQDSNRPTGQRLRVNVEFNYFAEYHGKSVCDQFFGVLAKIYEQSTCSSNAPDIRTTEQFIRMFNDAIHERGGYVIDDEIDFVKLVRTTDDHKINVHTLEFIPNYVTKDEIATHASERKSIISKQATINKLDVNCIVQWTLEPNQQQFPNKFYPKHLPKSSMAWGNFYSFKVASIQDINRFTEQEKTEQQFIHQHSNTQRRKQSKIEYGSNVFLASLNATSAPIRVSVELNSLRVNRQLKIGGDMIERSFRFQSLHKKSTYHKTH
jgi:hypothetical protein